MAKRKSKAIGLPPGAVIFTGKRKVEHIDIHFLQYNQAVFKERKLDNRYLTTKPETPNDCTSWYDIRGLHDTELIKILGEQFGIPPLIQEDIVDIHQRPKWEEMDEGILVILKAPKFKGLSHGIILEQVGLFAKGNVLLSFQEDEDDLFPSLRKRLRERSGRIRQRKTDYLLYALMDLVIDQYFGVIDKIEDQLENLEIAILESARSEHKDDIYKLKRQLLNLRKAFRPVREIVMAFSKSENPLIQKETLPFLTDLSDHVTSLSETLEANNERNNSLYELYLGEISYQMNSVMQMLTVISTIFIPLTFLAGIYGMNFELMPELKWRYGYLTLWALMIVIAGYLLWYFRRKRWL